MAIVILSPASVQKRWPKREFAALASRETFERRALVIPVLHGVTASEVAAHSPAFPDRVAIDSAIGIPGIADELEKVRRYSLDYLEQGQIATVLGPDGRPLAPDDPAKRSLDLSVAAFNDEVMTHLAENPRLLHELTPRRFEELVAEIYCRSGYEVELTPASGDGGADVYAVRRDDLGSTLIVVQAKRYKPDLKVEASAVRELLGTVDLTRASAGVLITTSSFRPGAEDLAEQLRWRLSLKDYVRLQQLLKKSAAARSVPASPSGTSEGVRTAFSGSRPGSDQRAIRRALLGWPARRRTCLR